MKPDMHKMLTEKLLQDLISKMEDKMGERMKPAEEPKAMEVSVAAPDKDHLSDGLDKAKDAISAMHDPKAESEDEGHESDEDRLRELLSEHDDDDEDEDKKKIF